MKTTKNDDSLPSTGANCGCGCGFPVERSYRMGHDARHAGLVARAAIEYAAKRGMDYLDDALYEALPSNALKVKAKKQASRLAQRGAKRGERKAAKKASFGAKDGDRTGTVRIGRWEYPARKNGRGEVVRNTKRDGSGTWAPADASKFKAL
jgi:hypothetical protein